MSFRTLEGQQPVNLDHPKLSQNVYDAGAHDCCTGMACCSGTTSDPTLRTTHFLEILCDTMASERLPGFRALGISPRSLEDELEAILRQNKQGV
jgi:hypothetical protein